MGAEKYGNVFYFLLVGAITLLTLFIFSPYLGGLVLAVALTILFSPLNSFFLRLTKGQEGIAAFCTVAVVLVIVLVPFTYLGYQVFKEARGVYLQVAGGDIETMVADIFAYLRAQGVTEITHWYPDAAASLRNISGFVFEKFVAPFFSGATQFFANGFITLLAFYYFLKDGKRLRDGMTRLSPLPDHYDREITQKIESALNSVVKGTLLIAVLQGILAGIGFFFSGIPNPAFWGSLTVVGALVPLVGTMLVIAPAVGYLILMGHLSSAFGLTLWAVLVVGLVDNLLKPHLIRQGVDIHPLFVLLSVLGGLQFFGPMGFLLGPVTLSLFMALAEIYPHLILHTKSHE